MTSAPIELGALLDGWVESGRVGLVETAPAVTVSGLNAAAVQELLAATRRLGWPCNVEDGAGEVALPEDIEDALAPFVATIQKDIDGADRRLLTRMGLKQALTENGGGIWQIAGARVAFATGTTSFNPWGGGDVFAPAADRKSPLNVVREASEARLVPSDIRKWLLRGELTEHIWREEAFQIFAAVSAPTLVRSLASEVLGQEAVVFSGPPRLNIVLPAEDLIQALGFGGYRNLQAAVSWVYEDIASTEQRHALFAAEFARSVSRTEPIGKVFQTAGRDILEGSRLAFQLSQSDLSREAIKAQGDLRRAIADDTAKAVEGTRSLSGAVAVAIVTAITLVAARSKDAAEPWVLSLVAVVVSLYVFAVAINGWAHLGVQRRLRDQWRHRLYRFVPADDYEEMVTKPARSAERPYHIVGVIALIVTAALLWLAYTVWEAESVPTPVQGVRETSEARKAAHLAPLPCSSPADRFLTYAHIGSGGEERSNA